MILRVEKPKLLFTTKNGKEIYLDPLTQKPVSRAVAFAGYEGLKNDAIKKVFLEELKTKPSNSEKKADISIISDQQGLTVSGKSDLEPLPSKEKEPLKKKLNTISKLYQVTIDPDEILEKDLPIIPFLFLTTRKIIKYFFNKDEFFNEDEDLETNAFSSNRSKQRKKKFSLLA